MPKALITVVERQHSDQQLLQIQALIQRLYKQHVAAKKLTILICEIPPGQFFTHYAASQSSICSVECDNHFPQAKRIAFLEALAAGWADITGQHLDSLMLALVEKALFKTILKSNQQRLSPLGRLRFIASIAKQLISNKSQRQMLVFKSDF